ncbi:sporulation histidine kinase inhibitor Sda [Metabacillus litoralis]|uniref:sporulation histidine kinase inhibitor Sda n=1 Tax=Metabacillus litoralis TaxID=152268 RepID=UPI001E5CC729|nr:sporulation histidine kinase inhibitor Sda [Metabacillus litoralis]UHA59724.1 sporulation histidine kinase inhibitor Sda [Metabacillus litoralis]
MATINFEFITISRSFKSCKKKTTLQLISNITLYRAYKDAIKLKASDEFIHLLLNEIESRPMPLPISTK